MSKKSEKTRTIELGADVGTTLDFLSLLSDVRALVAAWKTGDWFGDNGVLAVVQRMIGRIKTTGLDTSKVSAVSQNPAELESAFGELESLVNQTRDAGADNKVGDLAPEVKAALIELVKTLINVVIVWWRSRKTETTSEGAD